MEQVELLQYAADVLERLSTPYAVVGSYGSIAYGEPRYTQDIDILIDLKPAKIEPFCAAFPIPDFYISEDAVRDAVRSRFQFNVIENSTGNKLDFLYPRDDEWGRTQLGRRKQKSLVPGRLVYIASREDTILGKMIYYAEGESDKHLRDIKGILRISGDRVNRKEIERWAEKLGVADVWNVILMAPDAPT